MMVAGDMLGVAGRPPRFKLSLLLSSLKQQGAWTSTIARPDAGSPEQAPEVLAPHAAVERGRPDPSTMMSSAGTLLRTVDIEVLCADLSSLFNDANCRSLRSCDVIDSIVVLTVAICLMGGDIIWTSAKIGLNRL